MLKQQELLGGKIYIKQTIVEDKQITISSTAEGLVNLDAGINFDTMIAYLRSKFPDREHSQNKKLVSLLLNDLKTAGIKNYNQIEKIVNENLKWLDSFEKTHPPANSENHHFSDIGAIRIILTERFPSTL